MYQKHFTIVLVSDFADDQISNYTFQSVTRNYFLEKAIQVNQSAYGLNQQN